MKKSEKILIIINEICKRRFQDKCIKIAYEADKYSCQILVPFLTGDLIFSFRVDQSKFKLNNIEGILECYETLKQDILHEYNKELGEWMGR